MELFERQVKKYAIIINVNLVRATLNEAAEFREYLNEAILGANVDIIVNLSDCQHLDSTFLGVLVSAYKKLKSKQRNLVIIEPTDQSRVFLTLNSIGKIFPLYDNVNSALADIENKRMLENAADHIEDEPEEIDLANNFDTKNINQPGEETPITQKLVQEELTTIEIEEHEIDMETHPKSGLNSVEIEPENLSAQLEEVHENNVVTFESLNREQEKNITVPEARPLYSEVNFQKGSVDWAFGFN